VPGVREITLSDIEIGEKIGQGGFSVISKGTLNGTPVAIKKIFDPRLTDELLQEIQNEIVMQSIIRHPGVVMLMGVIPKIPDIYIVFEQVKQGSLFDLLHMKKNSLELNPKQRIKIALETAVVFEYMHNIGIVHRDIKSHNVLIDEGFKVKVCDFGLAKFTVSNSLIISQADLNRGSMQFAGTPTYMAPELFQKRSYDQSVDVYAFGCLLWEIINREVPFDGLDPSDIAAKVVKGEKLREHTLHQVSHRLPMLVDSCRQVEPERRPNFTAIRQVLEQIERELQ
jgi:serine/threonine protein kinase